MAYILLVDDDEAFRLMLRRTLTTMGHEVTEAVNGAKGWDAFKARPSDLVIMDLIMPEQEGLETIQLFRKNHVPVKILAVSGGGRIDARDLLVVAKQFGADEILGKPFSNEELSAALKRLLVIPEAKRT